MLEQDKNVDIKNKIVCIKNADPGFDWIFFSRNIGLNNNVWRRSLSYGNKMREFGFPAAIGCGEKIYNDVIKMNTITLDCKMVIKL